MFSDGFHMKRSQIKYLIHKKLIYASLSNTSRLWIKIVFISNAMLILLESVVEAFEQRFVGELDQQEVDQSHGTKKQTFDQNWQSGKR